MWHFDVLESTNETAKELLETDLEEGLVLWADRQPPDLQATATTMKREVNLFVANDEFLDYLLSQLDDLYSRYRNTKIEFLIKEYRGQCTTIGKKVSATTSKGTVTGRAYDIAPNGALIIMDEDNAKHEFVEGQLKILP